MGHDSPPVTSARAPLGIASLALLSLLAATASEAVVTGNPVSDARMWITNGPVRSSAVANGTLYVGGDFTHVSPPTGSFAMLMPDGSAMVDPVTRQPICLRANGSVNAAISDGSGGFFIGGDFTQVAGWAVNRLAHIDAGGHLTNWNSVNAGANDVVTSLALQNGVLYAGGWFTQCNGVSRTYIAALDAVSGALLPWHPVLDDVVNALAADSLNVYVGGRFNFVNGGNIHGFAAIRQPNGLTNSAFGEDTPDGPVYCLRYSNPRGGFPTIFLGGSFSTMFDGTRYVTRNNAACIYTTTVTASNVVLHQMGQLTVWDANVNGRVNAIEIDPFYDDVVVGGLFTSVGGTPANNLAIVSNLGDTFGPDPADGEVMAVHVGTDGSHAHLYAGGLFQNLMGAPHRFLGDINWATLLGLQPWDPGPSDVVNVISESGGISGVPRVIGVGGEFSGIGGVARNHLAALDVQSNSPTLGGPTAFDPGVDGPVDALALDGSTLFVGGAFAQAGGQARSNLAAVNSSTGAPTSWNPGVSGDVDALAVDPISNQVFAGGTFATAGGQSRANFAAINRSTGVASAWSADADGPVRSLVWNSGNNTGLYVGGEFGNLAGSPRNRLAALTSAGTLLPFSPPAFTGALPSVRALAMNNGTLFAGGNFTAGAHTNVAAFNPGSPPGSPPTPFVADVTCGCLGPAADALLAIGGELWVGGLYSTLSTVAGAQARFSLGSVNLASELIDTLPIDVSGTVLSLSGDASSNVFACGDFGGNIYHAPAGAARPEVERADRTGPAGAAVTAARPVPRAGPAAVASVGAVLGQGGVSMIHPSDAGPPTAVALGPQGSGPLPPDSVRTLTWSASDDLGVLSVDVLLSRSGNAGPWELLAGGVANGGALSWKVTGPVTHDAWMRVDVHDIAGNVTTAIGSAPFVIDVAPVGAVEPDRSAAFALSPIAPNPLHGAARVDFELPVRSRVNVTVFDVQGRQAANLADGEFAAGRHSLTLAAKGLQPGLYFVRMLAPGVRLERRAVVVR